MQASANRYLSENFAPIERESELRCEVVEGKLPTDLYGAFLRNGPNARFDPPIPELYHPFDGDGMIHSVSFENGKATYRNRWVRTAGLLREEQAKKALWGGFATGMRVVPPKDMPQKNLANTALVWHAGRLLALWEGGPPHELSLPELDTQGIETFEGKWSGSFTAHPTVDPRTGEMITFGYSIMKPVVHYGVIDKRGKLVHETKIALKKPVMIHDIAITEHYSLILDMPVTISIERMMRGGKIFDWEPENGARIGVLPRFGQGSEIRWFDVKAGYVYHVFNAYEEGKEIVLDACRMNETHILTESEADEADENARYYRYRLNLETGAASEEKRDTRGVDFSRINERYVGIKTRYGYASRFAGNRGVGPFFNAVIKYDFEHGTSETVELGPHIYTQEFVFAPRVGSQTEDDGYVVGVVRDEARNVSECWVIDARNFSAGPIAKLRCDQRIPYGFHSYWVSGEDIAAQQLHVTVER